MNRKIVLCVSMIIVFSFIILGCGNKKVIPPRHHYVDINNLVNRAYTSTNGYDSEMAKYMSEDVFHKSNAYSAYEKVDYRKPISASVSLKEINQHKIKGDIFVYMKNTLEVRDANGKVVAGGWGIPVVYTVTENDGELYIKDKQEYINENDVPEMYK